MASYFGITLKHFARLQAQGEKVKVNFWTARLLNKKPKDGKFKTHDLENLTVSQIVDLERFFFDEDYYNFCRIFVNKYFWQTVYLHNLSFIIEDYAAQKERLKENHPYIFDPPQYGEPEKETIGSELRKEFVEEFGDWVVLTDIVCKGRLADAKKIEKWKVSEFLFWANYLTGQKIVENVK